MHPSSGPWRFVHGGHLQGGFGPAHKLHQVWHSELVGVEGPRCGSCFILGFPLTWSLCAWTHHPASVTQAGPGNQALSPLPFLLQPLVDPTKPTGAVLPLCTWPGNRALTLLVSLPSLLPALTQTVFQSDSTHSWALRRLSLS